MEPAKVDPTKAQRRQIFLLTWLTYGSYYLCRRPFSIAKAAIAREQHLDANALALIDTGYLIAYAAGMFVAGLVCDRSGARRLLGVGMFLVAMSSAAFGLGSTTAVFAVAFTINGLAQSTGWPGVVKAMTAMYEPGKRGTVMGWWATCYQVGGLAATYLATALLVHFGWRWAFFVPAVLVIAVAVAVWLFLWEPPAAAPADRHKASLAIVKEPLVWSLGAAYFCVKLIRYCIVFWLPYFYSVALHYDDKQAGYFSTAFEYGGVVGAILSGHLFDKTGRNRGWLIVVTALLCAVSAAFYPAMAAHGPYWAFGGMVVFGFVLFGPDALVSSVAAQDLGKAEAAGTAAGFINGVGSVGAIAQGVLTAYVSKHYGWNAMFYVFGGLCVLAGIAVVPYAIAARRGTEKS